MVHKSVKKLKTREPCGSALWSDLLCYKIFAVENYSAISCASHISSQGTRNISALLQKTCHKKQVSIDSEKAGDSFEIKEST